jgi:hypothetical protein
VKGEIGAALEFGAAFFLRIAEPAPLDGQHEESRIRDKTRSVPAGKADQSPVFGMKPR